MIRVKATHEGLIGGPTASGLTISPGTHGCALPSHTVLNRWVRIVYGGQDIIVQVLDVGPWNTHDDNYVLFGRRPQAEIGKDSWGRQTNGAGIDLFDATWRALGMTDNDDVEWEFVTAPGIGWRRKVAGGLFIFGGT